MKRCSVVHPPGWATPPLRHRGHPAPSTARQRATALTSQRLYLSPPRRPASITVEVSHRRKRPRCGAGFDQAAPGVPLPVHRSPCVMAPRCGALVAPWPDAGTPHRARLGRPARPKASTCPNRPAVGRGGGPAATGGPHVCGRHTLQHQFLSIGVDTKPVNETRSRCRASTSSPKASRAPRTPLRHPCWRMRARWSRPRVQPWGN